MSKKNILSILQEQITLASIRDYLSGEQVAKETLGLVSSKGFGVYEVVRLKRSSRVDTDNVKTEIFMNLEKARGYVREDLKRLCELNKNFESFEYDCGLLFEIENIKNDALEYEYSIRKKEVS